MVNDWKASQIEELFTTSSGGTPKRSNLKFYENGNIPWVKTGELKKKYIYETEEYITEEAIKKSSAKIFPKNTVLLAMYGATIGNSSILATEASTNQACCAFLPSEMIDHEFMYYKLNFDKKKIISLGAGGAQPNISQRIVNKYIINYPPKKEQNKIAAILSSVDEAIEKTEQIIEQTETVKKGLMQQLLTKGIGHTEFKDSPIGKVPLSWEITDLKEVADKEEKYSFVGGPFGSDLTSKEYTESGVRIIQLQNIGDGHFLDAYKIYTTEQKADQLYKCNIFPGDIIIAKMAEPVARACIIPNTDERFLMASDGIRLKIDENRFDKNFVLYAINSPYFRNQAINNSTGTTRLRIGLKSLRSLKIAVPPLEEQVRISSIIGRIEDKLLVEMNKLNYLSELKNGLMQQLLTGKVRVQINENEEVPS